MVPVAYVDGWCRIAGIVIDEWFLDMGAGAAMHERPQGNALLDRVEPGDAILVFDASEIASTQEKGDQLVRLTNIKQVMLVATAVVDATFFV